MITEHKPKKLTLNEIERTTWEARAVMSKQKLKCNNSTKQMNYNNDKDKVGIKVANIKVKELYFLKEKQKLKRNRKYKQGYRPWEHENKSI